MNYENIGFIQGRFVPSVDNQIQKFPKNSWTTEFQIISKLNIKLIEWIFDDYDNPMLLDNKKINNFCKEYDIKINEICADFFMKHKLFSESEAQIDSNLSILKKLIENSSQLGIKIIEIPLVDISSLQTTTQKSEFSTNLKKLIPFAEKNDIILNLETDLPPIEFQNFICQFPTNVIKANYDVGNSTSLGYDIKNELIILKNLISNVHVKDRIIGGTTVPLGTGNCNFDLFFSTLSEINYEGDLIIQGARENETLIPPEETCLKYFNFVKSYLDKYFR